MSESSTPYFLGESDLEARRLREQAARDPVPERLKWAGLAPGMSAIDAGCGTGDVTQILAKALGPTGSVIGFDPSESRLKVALAQAQSPESAKMRFLPGDIYSPPVPAGEADFVYCQYVFEYLSDPARAFKNLVELAKPGGRVAVYDVDGIGGVAWPAPENVQRGLAIVSGAQLSAGGIDATAGRKLFHWAVLAGLRDIEVTVQAQIFAGTATSHEIEAWKLRHAQSEPAAPLFGGTDALHAFSAAHIEALHDPTSLKYTVFVGVRGTR